VVGDVAGMGEISATGRNQQTNETTPKKGVLGGSVPGVPTYVRHHPVWISDLAFMTLHAALPLAIVL